MLKIANKGQPWQMTMATVALGMMASLLGLMPLQAQAVPSFARQTGQNCVACHAGGQFPELTPYGRMFKMTGYTIGQRAMPLAVMGLASVSSVANPPAVTPPAGPSKNSNPIFAMGSVFAAGKITDNIGAFTQITYDNYAQDNQDGTYSGHTQADNMDFRFANHIIDTQRDWIYGLSLNNNPSVSDPWNTAAAWMQYVPKPSPTSSDYIDATTPYPGMGAGSNIAGLSAYLFWNKTVYAELGTYRTANQALSFMSAGIDDANKTKLDGSNNPYWRLALSHEWGAHNLMIGATGMNAHVYDGGTDIGDPANLGRFRNTGVDLQYQYLLDPHTVTVQFARMRQEQTYSDNALLAASLPTGLSDTTTNTRAKASYVYQAKYGGSLAYFNSTGSTNNQGDPATNGMTYEAFLIPTQNVRLGVQYTAYGKYQGASTNYDGAGRNASDNNSLFLYAWFAY